METPFWCLVVAGFIGSTIGRMLLQARKQSAQADQQQPEQEG